MNKQIQKALNWRYATKLFDLDKKILQKDLETILESGRLSPSSYGLQTWKFLVIESGKIREALKGASWGQSQITDASHLIVLCRPENLNKELVEKQVQAVAKIRNQNPDSLLDYKKMLLGFIGGLTKDQAESWMEKQVYIALGFMLESAALIGIDSCPMEGFDRNQYDEILNLKSIGLRSVVAITLGYRSLGDESAKRQKVRFDREELVLTIK